MHPDLLENLSVCLQMQLKCSSQSHYKKKKKSLKAQIKGKEKKKNFEGHKIQDISGPGYMLVRHRWLYHCIWGDHEWG